MGLLTLIPAAAALLCLETAVVFAVLYAKVGRRRADLIFSGLALCLAGIRWASFVRRGAPDVPTALVWLRWEWVGVFLALAIILHFVSVAIHEPLGPRLLAVIYLAAVALGTVPWADWFLRVPPSVPVAEMEPAARVWPFFYFIAPLPFLAAFAALMMLFVRAKRPLDTTLAPLAYHRTHTFAAGMAIVVAPAVVVIAEACHPPLKYLSIHSLAAVAFCLIIARALGKEILRVESEKQRLAQLAQFRTQAVRDVAHELKNPLAAIQMATETLLTGVQEGLDPPTQCRMLEMCLDACRRLTRLINNMLDTARMEAGRKVELRVEPTDIEALARSVLVLQQNTTLVHHLILKSELRAQVVPLDGDKVHQVLTNLVHNAIKYAPNGGDITVRLWDEADGIALSVGDQGIGMTPEQQARIFQPFERVVDPERRITGTGIGLHLVKRLVEAQGGRISVASRYGEGSTFTVVLPLVRRDA